jgi:hypothetical protein
VKGARSQKSEVRIAGLFLTIGVAALAQAPEALLAPKDLNQLCQRSIQLMEAGGISVPDLHNPTAPLIENARQSCVQLQAKPSASAPTYVLLMNLRAFIALADSVPKPFPFPEAARRQFAELRDDGARLDTHFRALLDSKEAQLVTPDHDDLDRYTDANRKVQPPNPKNPRVVFLGDAITDNWRLEEYFPDRDFINRGIGDQVSSQMLVRMKADVLDLHPEAVVIEAGTAAGFHQRPERMARPVLRAARLHLSRLFGRPFRQLRPSPGGFERRWRAPQFEGLPAHGAGRHPGDSKGSETGRRPAAGRTVETREAPFNV